ncbi:ankyrin repeat domain-containing protein, partial [Bdellovibrionota bacterium FG-1]
DQALHWALRDRRTTLAQTLIDAGAPIDDPGSVGKTPLMLAVALPLFVELLIKKGARINYMTNNRTPLICAALSGSLESTELLLAAGAMPGLGAVMGRTLLEFIANEDFVMGKDIRAKMIQLIRG